MKKTIKNKKNILIDTPSPSIEVTPPEKDIIKELASKDVHDLITKLNLIIETYKKKESPLNAKQKELVLRRMLSFWSANWSFSGAKVSIHISDDLGYGWEQVN